MAQSLGVSGAMVSKWKAKGMPVDDLGSAKNWLSINVPALYRATGNSGDIPPPEKPAGADQDTWESRLKRSRDTERNTHGLLTAAIQSSSSAQIPGLLKSHSAAVEAVATAEKLASDARIHTGDLIHRETVRSIMRELLIPLREALDKLPAGQRTNCNPDHPDIAERALTEWRDKLLVRANAIQAKF